MTDMSDLYAQLRDQAPVSGPEAIELATAFATMAVRDLRATSNKYAETDPYEVGKPQFWDALEPDPKTDPAVRSLATIFLQMLSRRDLLRI
jgi:hypothetical protein